MYMKRRYGQGKEKDDTRRTRGRTSLEEKYEQTTPGGADTPPTSNSIYGQGKDKDDPDEYEAERRSKKNVGKPPQEEWIRLQPATPAALTTHLLHQAPPSLAASAVSLPDTPTPMEVLVEEALDEGSGLLLHLSGD